VDLTSTGPQPPSFHLVCYLRIKLSMHCKELSCLEIHGFYLLLWPGHSASMVYDDWQGVLVDGLDFVLLIQLTLQELPYSLLGIGFVSHQLGCKDSITPGIPGLINLSTTTKWRFMEGTNLVGLSYFGVQ